MPTPVQKKYTAPVIATDIVIFTIKENTLHVLLIKMKKHPFEKSWALPGGLVAADQSVDDAAKHQLLTKTGVKNVYLEQLYTFGDVNRDPFGRVISVAYFALVPSNEHMLATTEDYGGVTWFAMNKLPALAYDHKKIITYAHERLKSRVRYSNIAYGLLPKECTLTELQGTYEIILGEQLDKRNFRKKILSLGLLKKSIHIRRGTRSRPAQLYQFTKKQMQVVDVL